MVDKTQMCDLDRLKGKTISAAQDGYGWLKLFFEDGSSYLIETESEPISDSEPFFSESWLNYEWITNERHY